jgi:hypothetical protein
MALGLHRSRRVSDERRAGSAAVGRVTAACRGSWRLSVPVALVLAWGCASTVPDWRDVRLVRDPVDVRGCTLMTILKDEDMDDLRRKAAESGGDTVLLTGTEKGPVPVLEPARFVADVYRCRPAGQPAMPGPRPGSADAGR